MAAASFASSCTITPESVYERVELFEANNNILVMTLMEETQEDEFCGADDRLMDMIQSLEAEISSNCSSCSPAPYCNYQSYDFEVGQVDGQGFFMSSVSCWGNIEEGVSASSSSSSSYDEDMMEAWSLCVAGGDDNTSEFYYGVLLENNYLPSPQEASEVM